MVKQISIFVENKSGRLAEITRLLAEKDIDISAMSIADTTDFGILRLIVNKPDEAYKALKEYGVTAKTTEVIAIGVEDKPGGLNKALELLQANGIDIEYMYAFIGKSEHSALVILRVAKPQDAVVILKENGIRVVGSEEVYSM